MMQVYYLLKDENSKKDVTVILQDQTEILRDKKISLCENRRLYKVLIG